MKKNNNIQEKLKVKNRVTEKDFGDMSKTVFNSLGERLRAGETVKIRGFGTFSVSMHQARNGVNPKTGQKIKIPPKAAVKLSLSKKLKRVIQEGNTKKSKMSSM